MADAPKLNRVVVSDMLDIHDVSFLFNKIWLTILNWRKTRSFPYTEILGSQKPVVRYKMDQVIKWAKDNDESIDPDRLSELRAMLKARIKQPGSLESVKRGKKKKKA